MAPPTFSNLGISGAAGGRTLTFSASGLTSVTSRTVTIGAGGASSAFIRDRAQQQRGRRGDISGRDRAGSGYLRQHGGGRQNAITLALGANTGGATLGGTLTVNAVNGVATFSDLTLDKTGVGYTLTAAATSLSGDVSAAFNITPSTATQLVFTVQPSSVAAGSSISPAIVVTAQDASGNTDHLVSYRVSLSIGTNAGGGTRPGGAVAPVNGVASSRRES